MENKSIDSAEALAERFNLIRLSATSAENEVDDLPTPHTLQEKRAVYRIFRQLCEIRLDAIMGVLMAQGHPFSDEKPPVGWAIVRFAVERADKKEELCDLDAAITAIRAAGAALDKLYDVELSAFGPKHKTPDPPEEEEEDNDGTAAEESPRKVPAP